jgi:transposase
MAKPILEEELWQFIEPVLPPLPPRRKRYPGRKPVSNRQALTGILFVLKTGIPWEYLPQELGCGSGMTCWRRLRDWQKAGVWEKLHQLLLQKLQAQGVLDWSVAVADASSVRAVGAGKKQAQVP